jgi:hypothetical protein
LYDVTIANRYHRYYRTAYRAEFISNFENIGNSTKCKSCEDLALQLPHALYELSLVRLTVDLLSTEFNRMQSESPTDTTMTKQWIQVSYTHQ